MKFETELKKEEYEEMMIHSYRSKSKKKIDEVIDRLRMYGYIEKEIKLKSGRKRYRGILRHQLLIHDMGIKKDGRYMLPVDNIFVIKLMLKDEDISKSMMDLSANIEVDGKKYYATDITHDIWSKKVEFRLIPYGFIRGEIEDI